MFAVIAGLFAALIQRVFPLVRAAWVAGTGRASQVGNAGSLCAAIFAIVVHN
jgi:hypothetical protein